MVIKSFTLGRLLPILILCDIIAGTGLADAGQVAVTEDPCLWKTSLCPTPSSPHADAQNGNCSCGWNAQNSERSMISKHIRELW